MEALNNMEIWKYIPSWKGFYQASTHGRIRSVNRIVKQRNGRTQLKKGKILSLAIDRAGYIFCALSKNNKLTTIKVHRLIGITHVKNPNGYKEINHLDGIKSNNYAINLEWSTRSLNIRHAIDNGLMTYHRGEDHCSSKLSNKDREHIKSLRKQGLTLKRIASKYPVHLATISKICKS